MVLNVLAETEEKSIAKYRFFLGLLFILPSWSLNLGMVLLPMDRVFLLRKELQIGPIHALHSECMSLVGSLAQYRHAHV